MKVTSILKYTPRIEALAHLNSIVQRLGDYKTSPTKREKKWYQEGIECSQKLITELENTNLSNNDKEYFEQVKRSYNYWKGK